MLKVTFREAMHVNRPKIPITSDHGALSPDPITPLRLTNNTKPPESAGRGRSVLPAVLPSLLQDPGGSLFLEGCDEPSEAAPRGCSSRKMASTGGRTPRPAPETRSYPSCIV